jgi:hypothetical protein
VLVLASVALLAQTGATRVISSGTLPASCNNGAVYVKTGTSKGWYVCDGGTWVGPYPTVDTGGAPTTAQYWTGAADGTLSAEKNLGALSTGLVINTSGTPSAYAGDTCGAGDFVTAVSASGVVTCDTPAGGGNVTTSETLTSGVTIVGNGTTDIKKSTLTAAVVKSASGTLSAATAGTDYLNPSTGLTKIEEATPTGTSHSFSSLGTFTHLKLVYSARGDAVATSVNINLTFNGDTGNNYDVQNDIASGTSAQASEGLAQANAVVATISAASAPAGAAGVGEIVISDYRGTTFRKGGTATTNYKLADTSGNFVVRVKGFQWRDTSAITSITLTLSSGNYVSGSKLTLYGMPYWSTATGFGRRGADFALWTVPPSVHAQQFRAIGRVH